MSNQQFKSIVRESPCIFIEIEFEDDRENHDEIYSETLIETMTIGEIIQNFLIKFERTHVPQDQIHLIRISHSNQRFPFPIDYRHRNLIELKIEDDYRLQFRRPNWILPVENCDLRIWGPNFQNDDWIWDKNSSTLQMLIDHVVEIFSLKQIDKTRIHLFSKNEEINLSLHPETLISQLGIDKFSSIRVQIIPPLSPMTHLFDKEIHVKCIYFDKEFILKVSSFDSPMELEKKIQKNLGNYRLVNMELFDANGQQISKTDRTLCLGMIGIRHGDRIVAHLQVESLSSTSSDHQQFDSNEQIETKQVVVRFSPKCYSFDQFYISINETMGFLIRKIDDTTKCFSNRKLRIRCRHNDLDQNRTDQQLIDLGVDGKNPIHVTIAFVSSFQTCITNPLYSTTTTTMIDYDKKSTSKPIGLSNIGNTCFMNSALQCLAHVKPLTDFFLNPNEKHFNEDQQLTTAYAQLLKTIWLTSQTTTRSYSSLFRETSHRPYDIKEIIGNLAPRFATYEQQDAQEFMTFFLDRLHKEFKDSTTMDKQSKKIIKDLFYGKLYSTITCLKCQNQYRTTNSFNLLSLPLNVHERIFSIRFVGRDGLNDSTIVQIQNHLQVKHLIRNFKSQNVSKFYRDITVMINDEPVDYETPLKNILTNEVLLFEQDDYDYHSSNYSSYLDEMKIKIRLDECLEEFFSEEHLDDPIECENHCRERTAAKKQFQLESLPPILIIQLKRFSHENGYKSKIETFVDYPVENLDLNRFVRSQSTRKENENNVYDLFAVSNHMGSIHFGHYTAFARRDDKWYRFNDSFVSEVINESDIVSRDAYLLFYIKHDEKETTTD